MTGFDAVEAQQHIEEARKSVALHSDRNHVGSNHMITVLVADLELAGAEVTRLTNVLGDAVAIVRSQSGESADTAADYLEETISGSFLAEGSTEPESDQP